MKGKSKKYERYTEQLHTSGRANSAKSGDCNIIILPKLKNVQPGITKVTSGQILPVILENGDKVAVLNTDGNVCGYIITAQTAKLIDCLKLGNTYQATVISITGAVCEVKVENT